MTGQTLVIVNPTAGSKAGLPTNSVSEADLRRALAENGIEAELFTGNDAAQAAREVRRAADAGYATVVAAGGDGTVSLVAKELLGRPTCLGILPLGSAMNFGRSLQIPRQLEAAVRLLHTGQPRSIDVGEIEGRLFFEIASIGVSAEMLEAAQDVDRGAFGGLAQILTPPFQAKPARVRLTMDGRVVETRAFMIEVANTPYTGLGLNLAPGAKLDDGRFDVRVFRRLSGWALIRYFASILWGRTSHAHRVQTYRAAEVTVEAEPPLACRADTLDICRTPCRLSIRRGALKVIAPVPDALPTRRQ